MTPHSPAPVQGVPVADNTSVFKVATPNPRGRALDVASTAKALRSIDTSMPPGLATCVARAVGNFPLRIMIVDNSGSMQSGDGQRLVSPGGRARMLSCSRWAELTDDVVGLAAMAEAMQARTDFHLLNPRPGIDALSIASGSYQRIPPVGPVADYADIQMAMKQSPGGTTPLTEAVMRVVAMIEPHTRELRAQGETVAVIIATDGLPDDPASFQAAMQQLQRLPVWLVVRLCTDDDNIVEFWNSLDEQLEAPLEVLDDLRSEATEVMSANPWLVYGPALHSARLFGLPGKLFDAIDEQTLTPSMIKDFLEDLLGLSGLPEPELDRKAFVDAIRSGQAELPDTLNPKSLQRTAWVNINNLERTLKSGGRCESSCALM